jgi:hypothetical protein
MILVMKNKMKKILLSLLMVASTSTFASHILGGMLAMSHDPNSQPNNQAVALYLITDPQGILPVSQTVSVYIENNNFYQFSENVTVTRSYTDTMADGKLLSTYVSAYKNFYMHKYRFVYSHCCRGITTNASNSFTSDFLIALDVDRLNAVNNNTPMPNYLPTSTLPQNWTTSFDLSNLIDDSSYENDSIQYEMWDALGQYANNTFVPLAPFTQLTSYGTYNVGGGGMVDWTPSTVGNFVTGYKLTEWRSGGIKASQCYVQMTYTVTPSSIGIEEYELEKKVVAVYDWQGRLIQKSLEGLKPGGYIVQYTNHFEKLFVQ